MKAPLSWLKEFVDIGLKTNDLMWKLTEIGLTTESFEKIDNDIVFETEVTPNRPDWLSIIGIAREIAAIENKKIRLPLMPDIPKPKKVLPLSIKTDYQLSPRYSGIIISDVKISASPNFIQERLKKVGLRPINNLVDITNYCMFELGIPIHVFDYDKFLSQNLSMELSRGGESFSSVDEIKYVLPKGAIIIKDTPERVIDLCGIKGGGNTGIGENTKNIFIHVPIYNPILVRKASQSLKLASEASYIYERGANAGGTIDTLKRVVFLMMKYAKGNIASNLIDEKKEKFELKKLTTSLAKIENVLGLKIPETKILSILDSLNLSPKIAQGKLITTIPTYRGDIKADEDIIEEIARIYGYNNFPKTLPVSSVNKRKIPYFFDNTLHLQIKNLLVATGFSESMNLSLISKNLIQSCQLPLNKHLKIVNPVSNEYEYLRNSLIPSLIKSLKINENEERVKVFELAKVYNGNPDRHNEPYKLSALAKGISFRELKGVLDLIFSRFNIKNLKFGQEIPLEGLWHPNKSSEIIYNNKTAGFLGYLNPQVLHNHLIVDDILGFELDLKVLEEISKKTIYKPISQFPAQLEDLTFTFPEKTKIGTVLENIRKIDRLIFNIELTDIYKDAYTFKIWYQHPKKTLNDREVENIRLKIIQLVKNKFGGRVK